jgi:hypothetical protein
MAQINPMTTRRAESKTGKPQRGQGDILGRSPVTGRFVYKPALKKGGTITQRQANAAVTRIYAREK